MNHLAKISVLLFACFLLVPESQAASFRPLGFMGYGQGVSDDGGVVVGQEQTGVHPTAWSTAFRWTPENGMESLGLLPGGVASSTASDVSADGRVIVGESDSDSPDGNEAFRWTESTGMQKIGDLGGEQRAQANAVNANGSVIVGLSTSELGFEAFRWTVAGGMVGLGDIPDGQFASEAQGVSADGNVVVGVGRGPSFSREAFRWTEAGGMVALGQLSGGSNRAVAWGISPDGSAVVGSASSTEGDQAFFWTAAGGMIGLGDLPGNTFWSRALDASTNGEVVVGWGDTDPNYSEAFVWTQADGMRRLIDVLLDNGATGLDGWIITTAEAISANGLWVVGSARPPGGSSERQPYLAYLGEGNPDPGASSTDLQLEVLSDLDGDQSPEIAATTRELATGELKVRVVSPMNRAIIGNINFGQEPFRGITSLRDPATGETNGIAVLSERQDARLRLQVRDVTSGALVNNQVYFWGAFSPVGLATLSDLGGGSSDDVAVLGVPSPFGQPAVQIRDGVSGALVKNAYFVDETWQVKQLLDLGETDYRSGTDIGVLAVNVDGDIKIPLADAATGTPIRDLKLLNDNWEPLQAIVIPDYSGNGIAEVALLGSKKGTNRLIIQVRDGRNNAFLTNILPFSAAWRPVKMALLPDRNANGAAEIAIMAVKEGSDRLLVQVRDSRTGQFLRNLTPLSAKWDPKDMAVLPNLDGGVTGLAVLATRREDGRVIIQTINATNDSLISNVFLD